MFSLTSSNGFSQLTLEPTHIQANSSSCIELVFTDQQNLSVNSRVHVSLHPNCHHQIVHSSFNLNIYYLQTYERLIWDYKKADSKNIGKTLDSVNLFVTKFQTKADILNKFFTETAAYSSKSNVFNTI